MLSVIFMYFDGNKIYNATRLLFIYTIEQVELDMTYRLLKTADAFRLEQCRSTVSHFCPRQDGELLATGACARCHRELCLLKMMAME